MEEEKKELSSTVIPPPTPHPGVEREGNAH